MIPIPVFWTKYTTTLRGSVFKFVPCENCSTEYVYRIEREGTGIGTSMYSLNNDGAASHSRSAAGETLASMLENDFDPVPCPACGHYQRYMFPKLLQTKWQWAHPITLALVVVGSLSCVIGLYWAIIYLQHPNIRVVENMVTAWTVMLAAGIIGLGFSLIKRFALRNFDPNLEDQQARIAIGKNRAITRAEFEAAQKAGSEADR